MTPEILVYEEGRLKITAAAYGIPELKAIIDKFDMNAEPYLMYIMQMTSPVSPYANRAEEEKDEEIIFDVINTVGDFDPDDELIKPALLKLTELYTTALSLMADELGQELHRYRILLKNTPVEFGFEGNFRERMGLMEKIEKISSSYLKVKEQAEKELKVKMRGKAQLGEY